jgi:hypothetical protein
MGTILKVTTMAKQTPAQKVERSLMFPDTKAWNVITGCPHNCAVIVDGATIPYCAARLDVLPRVSRMPHYKENGFNSAVNAGIFARGPPRCKKCFPSFMGDAFACTVPDMWIKDLVLRCHIEPVKRVQEFWFLTKNPARYQQIFFDDPTPAPMSPRFVFGTTIETNRDRMVDVRTVPAPSVRARELAKLKYVHPGIRTFVSIEPVLDFDFEDLLMMLVSIIPEVVYIGYDNHHHIPKTAMPITAKVKELEARMKVAMPYTTVIEKTILEVW